MYNSSGISIALIFITVGIGFKLSPAPSHQWTPDVYEGVRVANLILAPLQQWRPPDSSWFQLNVDGVVEVGSNSAATGGVLRNGNGDWVFEFARSIGKCSTILVELWVVLDGLKHAWRLGIHKVAILSDIHKALVSIEDASSDHIGSAIILDIREILSRN
ncbi:hypothetical protein V6N11_000009 [Hibiscus sabdariffa]|uniref:Uncharacterized protein n=2 Tax=Hibiscus sabdariffa TaxID=183260 RepID=A0ABR2EFG7_9ROSI